MEIRWLTAFIDLPPDRFDAGVAFWCSVTGSALSPPRGEEDQFATLLPPSGDPYLRVQRLDGDEPRIHLDLHVGSIADGVARATELGAEIIARPGHAILLTPGGFTFCLVEHRVDGDHAEADRAEPLPDPVPHLLDQVCLDIAADRFEAEVAFWSELTGWPARRGSLDEFAVLDRPAGQPLRLLLQRLGPEDDGPPARAHLDLACGPDREAVAAHHLTAGAGRGTTGPVWLTMTDPVGMVYCVTARDPRTGTLPSA